MVKGSEIVLHLPEIRDRVSRLVAASSSITAAQRQDLLAELDRLVARYEFCASVQQGKKSQRSKRFVKPVLEIYPLFTDE